MGFWFDEFWFRVLLQGTAVLVSVWLMGRAPFTQRALRQPSPHFCVAAARRTEVVATSVVEVAAAAATTLAAAGTPNPWATETPPPCNNTRRSLSASVISDCFIDE
jgi:hypothetical protein